MQLANYLGYLHRAELNLAEGFRKVADGHAVEVDIYHTCNTLAKQCVAHAEKLQPFVERYGEEKPEERENLYHELFGETRSGGLGLLLAVALHERLELLCVGLALLGQGVASVVDVDLYGVTISHLPETLSQVELGPVQITEVVGELHEATPFLRSLRPRRLCRPWSPAAGRRKQARRRCSWVPVQAYRQRRRSWLP